MVNFYTVLEVTTSTKRSFWKLLDEMLWTCCRQVYCLVIYWGKPQLLLHQQLLLQRSQRKLLQKQLMNSQVLILSGASYVHWFSLTLIFFPSEYCKELSKRENMGELSSLSGSEESDSEKPFHHPFQVKDRPSFISLNIKVMSTTVLFFFFLIFFNFFKLM